MVTAPEPTARKPDIESGKIIGEGDVHDIHSDRSDSSSDEDAEEHHDGGKN